MIYCRLISARRQHTLVCLGRLHVLYRHLNRLMMRIDEKMNKFGCVYCNGEMSKVTGGSVHVTQVIDGAVRAMNERPRPLHKSVS